MYEDFPFWMDSVPLFITFFFGAVCVEVANRVGMLDDRSWRQIEVLAHFLTVFALVGAAGEARTWLAGNWENTVAERARGNANLLKFDLARMENYFCHRSFQRSDMSPPDFDEIVMKHGQACSWTAKAMQSMSIWDAREFKAIPSDIAQPPHFGNAVIDSYFSDFHSSIDAYQTARDAVMHYGALKQRTAFEEIVRVLWPLLGVLATVLRLAKPLGEIRSMKLKQLMENEAPRS